jgi:hypothetical protein
VLVAGGVDLVSIKDAMGHSQLATTSRYLHARPATERAAAFTAALEAAPTRRRIPDAETASRSQPSRSETRGCMRDVRSNLLALASGVRSYLFSAPGPRIDAFQSTVSRGRRR